MQKRLRKLKAMHEPSRAISPALIDALNHPVRRQVLRVLNTSEKPRSPSDLARDLGWELPAISFHARVLSEKAVTRCTRTERVRGSIEHFYLSNVSTNELVLAALAGTEADDNEFLKALGTPPGQSSG
jgi:DNA-binding transcriptional ArsR family regulator